MELTKLNCIFCLKMMLILIFNLIIFLKMTQKTVKICKYQINVVILRRFSVESEF